MWEPSHNTVLGIIGCLPLWQWERKKARPLWQLVGVKWSTITPGYSTILPLNTLIVKNIKIKCKIARRLNKQQDHVDGVGVAKLGVQHAVLFSN